MLGAFLFEPEGRNLTDDRCGSAAVGRLQTKIRSLLRTDFRIVFFIFQYSGSLFISAKNTFYSNIFIIISEAIPNNIPNAVFTDIFSL